MLGPCLEEKDPQLVPLLIPLLLFVACKDFFLSTKLPSNVYIRAYILDFIFSKFFFKEEDLHSHFQHIQESSSLTLTVMVEKPSLV